jgi:hypothetical protein
MTLLNETAPIEEDPITYSELLTHSTNVIACPYCGESVEMHFTGEDPEHHIHTPRDDFPICRRLYDCPAPHAGLFYAYKSLIDGTVWKTVTVRQGATEKVDDMEEMIVGIGHKKASLKPAWRFRTKDATKEDFTAYLNRNLVLGLELEYDFKNQTRPPSEREITDYYGLAPTPYHRLPECPTCGSMECWNHLPENLIRSIEKDASITGWEFVLYGSNLPSEDFVKRFPMAKLKRYFMPTESNSLHVHAMLVHNIIKLPNVIAKNMWQLFRFYYPAWVNLFGNYKASQGFLRVSHGSIHNFAHFPYYKRSPFSPAWADGLNEHNNNTARAGLYFVETPVGRPLMDTFDIEFRTPDSTFDMEQIVSARALIKALILRGAQLANFGLISVETDKETWEKVKSVIEKLEKRAGITLEDEAFMREHSIRLLKELAPFLSEFERECVKHLIENPVRQREPAQQTTERLVTETSPVAKQLHRIIALAEIESASEADWVSKVAALLGINNERVIKALAELKVYYDANAHNMVING